MFYIIKKNNEVYLNHIFVFANNLKEAKKKTKDVVRSKTGSNAFCVTNKVDDIKWRCTVK